MGGARQILEDHMGEWGKHQPERQRIVWIMLLALVTLAIAVGVILDSGH
jgi:flagellar basal body-associated protein FliL